MNLSREILRSKDDFALWCRLLLAWDPHEGQVSWGTQRAKRSLLVTGSRYGKSEVEAAKFLWLMFWNPGHRYLNCSITQDQADIVVTKAGELARHGLLGDFVEREYRMVVKGVKQTFPVLRFVNGAELWSRSTVKNCEYIRGHSFHGINYDEAAFGNLSHFDVLELRVADYDGWISITTTPKGKNWLYSVFVETQSEMERELARSTRVEDLEAYAQQGSSWDNPHLPRTALERLRHRLTQRAYRQEVMGEFVELEGATFLYDDIERIFDPEYQPEKFPSCSLEDRRNPLYVTGWDLGRKRTYTVGTTVEGGSAQIRGVHLTRLERTKWPAIVKAIKDDRDRWGAEVILDATGLGDPVMEFVDHESKAQVEGFLFTKRSRGEILMEFQKEAETPGALLFPADWRELRTDMTLHTWEEDAEGRTWDDLDSAAMAVHQVRYKAGRRNVHIAFV